MRVRFSQGIPPPMEAAGLLLTGLAISFDLPDDTISPLLLLLRYAVALNRFYKLFFLSLLRNGRDHPLVTRFLFFFSNIIREYSGRISFKFVELDR